MLVAIIIIFAIAAMGGLYLLSYILAEKNTPKGIALLHGTAAFTGIVVLAIGCYFYPALTYSLILFILAAAGGATLFMCDLFGKKIPKSLAIGHGLMAICGLILLIFLSIPYFT